MEQAPPPARRGHVAKVAALGHSAPIRVFSRTAAGTGRCVHLVVCERTQAAAIIDPVPELAQEIAAMVADRGLRLRLVLRTRVVASQAAAGARYASLLSELGLAGAARGSSHGPPPWEGLPWAGPLERAAGPGEQWIQAGPVQVRLVEGGEGGPVVTVGGAGGLPPEGARVAGLRAAVGAFHVHALPLVQDGAGLAWQVADRLFTGLPLRHSGAPGTGTPTVLLDLSPDTLVYAGQSVDGHAISSVEQEARVPWHRAGEDGDAGARSTHRHLRLLGKD